MKATTRFKSGNSQAASIPQQFKRQGNTVEIFKRNHALVTREIPANLSYAFGILTKLPDDFFKEGRHDLPSQRRQRG